MLLLAADFPTVLVAFAAPQLKPAPLVFAMLVDYSDYDLLAPSVRFVDPFTATPYKASELPTPMMRSIEQPLPPGLVLPPAFGQPPGAEPRPQAGSPEHAVAAAAPQLRVVAQQPLLQAHAPEDIPFLCLPGIREYHAHPGHSGDPWELHRTSGAGSLARLIDVVRTYAVEPIAGWNVNLVPQVGLGYGEPPR